MGCHEHTIWLKYERLRDRDETSRFLAEVSHQPTEAAQAFCPVDLLPSRQRSAGFELPQPAQLTSSSGTFPGCFLVQRTANVAITSLLRTALELQKRNDHVSTNQHESEQMPRHRDLAPQPRHKTRTQLIVSQ